MVIGSLASKATIGLVSLGVVTATGIGIWQLQSSEGSVVPTGKKTVEPPNNLYRWLEIDKNKKDDDDKWKQKISKYKEKGGNALNFSFTENEEENSKIEKMKSACSTLRSEEFEGEIPQDKKNLTKEWCVSKKAVKELLANSLSKLLSFENSGNENEWNKKFEEYDKASNEQKKGLVISDWKTGDKNHGIKKLKEECKKLQDQELNDNFENLGAFQKWCTKLDIQA